MATKQANSISPVAPPSRSRIFLKFSIPTLVVFLLVLYLVTAAMDTKEKMQVGIGFLFLYLIFLGIVWHVSRTLYNQALSLHDYATRLEAKVKEHTKNLEESTQREIAAIKELSRLKDDFVFVAAHEVRSPVTIIQWSIDKFLHEEEFLRSLPKDLRHAFDVLESAAKRLSMLIVDLLSVARLDSGTLTFTKKPLVLKDLLNQLLDEFNDSIQDKKITIHFPEEKFNELPEVLGDELRLKEVFANLLSNAVKFNHPDGKIEFGAKVDKKFVRVSVEDTGVGISKENLPKIFAKFFRAREDIDGTGLGLWISKEIMRRLDGEITVKSEEGKGTTFEVSIPIKS